MREKTFVERREHRGLQQGSEARDAVPNRDDDQRRDCQPDYQQNKECDSFSRDDPLRRLLYVVFVIERWDDDFCPPAGRGTKTRHSWTKNEPE